MKSKKIPLVLTLDAAASKKKAAVMKALHGHGFEVDSHLEGPGIITGRAAAAKVSALAKIAGVTVERDQSVQLPPPDAAVQ